MASSNRIFSAAILILSALCLFTPARADDIQYIYGTNAQGVTQPLALNRYPALYTGDFGDCLGGQSLFNITKFDAAYYADNLTIVFHLDGTSNIKNESLMMHISVDAYGEERYGQTFDPCFINVYSLCPLNASVPITGWALFPVGPEQIGGIPEIAFSIPDFEGSAKLQIFANSTQTEIGCFQAVMRNGNSFSQPEAVSPVLGAFTLVAILASLLTAAYGVSVPHMRTHYAHSLSAVVVFETFQTIFLSGLLNVDFPSVLIAWWSNFAWSAGMIYSGSMIQSINAISGVTGNASQVGGAGSVVINNGGGLITQIYGRSLATRSVVETIMPRDEYGASALVQRAVSKIMRRSDYNASDPYDYTWAGNPVTPGMPLPGTWTGFPGTLSELDIPSADAFLVSLIWLAVALTLVAAGIAAVKLIVELLVYMKKIEKDGMDYFRSHWKGYMVVALLRTFLMAFSVMMTLTMFQFAIKGPAGPTAIAVIIFIVFFVGIMGLVIHACRIRTKDGKFQITSDEVVFYHAKLFKVVPYITYACSSTITERKMEVHAIAGIPFFRIQHISDNPDRVTVHLDKDYVTRWGWLSARFRRTKWWFFAYYVGYQFVRACFLGGAVNEPLAQVFGLLIVEVLSFLVVIHLNPFEGARNTALAVWMLGISKIITAGISIAFLPGFNLDRILVTVLGVIIIVVQGLLVIGLLILIFLGAISSWMSLTRNREEFPLDYLESIRLRFFENMEKKAPDTYIPPALSKKAKGKQKEEAEKGKDGKQDGDGGGEKQSPLQPPQPYFAVNSVRRNPKIEDEDDDVIADLQSPPHKRNSTIDLKHNRLSHNSRTNSVSSLHSVSTLPRAARVPRASWSSRDFAQWDMADRPDSALAQRLSASHIQLPDDGPGSNRNSTAAASTATTEERPQSSRANWATATATSTPSATRPSTPSRETLAKHFEQRRFQTPLPPTDPR